MSRQNRIDCINLMYQIYPMSRRLVLDTFDKQNIDLTRTQQIIILALSVNDTLTMSQLAKKVNTSNEQATRAVSQLVDKEFISRTQDAKNRRKINICLTQKARDFMTKTKASILDELLKRFEAVPDSNIKAFYDALTEIVNILKVADR